MAKKIITKLLDDLDGGEADETLTFALDGMGYEIDLSSRNSKALRDFLETYIEAATRTGRIGSGAQLTRHRPTMDHMRVASQNRELNQNIRDWAIDNGWDVAERGRIPQSIIDAYHSKTPNPARTKTVPVVSEEDVTPAKKAAPAKKTVGSKVVNFKPERVAS